MGLPKAPDITTFSKRRSSFSRRKPQVYTLVTTASPLTKKFFVIRYFVFLLRPYLTQSHGSTRADILTVT